MKRSIKLLFVLSLCTLLQASATAQRVDKKLTAKLEELLTGFQGDLGVYVHDLRKDRVAAIGADSIFPTASMIKVPILVGVMEKAEAGSLQFNQELIYKDSLLYEGEDILGSFKAGEKIQLGKAVMLMLNMSDNTASLWLQSLAGGGARINELMDSAGFQFTRVNSRTPGREDKRKQYGWGQTTPREMAGLIERIVKGDLINKAASSKMLRLLGRNYWDEHAISAVPAGVFIASKNGAVDGSRSEVLYVNGEGRSYIFCICTKNIQDQRWENNNEAWQLATKVSKLLWDYFK